MIFLLTPGKCVAATVVSKSVTLKQLKSIMYRSEFAPGVNQKFRYT